MQLFIHRSWESAEGADRRELVFENRFKEYGAYVLRKSQDRNKVIAMLLTSVLCFGALSCTYLFADKSRSAIIINIPRTNDTVIYADPFPLKEEQPQKQEQGSPQGGNPNEAGAVNFDPLSPDNGWFSFFGRYGRGRDTSTWGEVLPTGGGNNSDGQSGGGGAQRAFVDYDPQPADGMSAFKEEVRDAFMLPAGCELEGNELWVDVRFTVDKTGRLINVVQTGGREMCPGYVQEIQRVLQQVSPWIPGTVGGWVAPKQVSLRFKLVLF